MEELVLVGKCRGGRTAGNDNKDGNNKNKEDVPHDNDGVKMSESRKKFGEIAQSAKNLTNRVTKKEWV